MKSMGLIFIAFIIGLIIGGFLVYNYVVDKYNNQLRTLTFYIKDDETNSMGTDYQCEESSVEFAQFCNGVLVSPKFERIKCMCGFTLPYLK